MEYYIYKYVKENIVEYIGKTINLQNRIKDHTKDKLANLNCDIYYFKCPNKTAMDSWEYFLINKYHPKYNIALKDKNVNIKVIEPEWIKYNPDTFLDKNIIFSLEKTLSAKKLLKPQKNIEFRCKRCHITFTTNKWFTTKKGYSASCPNCSYSMWVSKEQVKRKEELEKIFIKKWTI